MQELEAKFYVRHLKPFEQKLIALGANILRPRILETNLRFDTPDHQLSQRLQMLRLRKAHTNTLTYKGASQVVDGASQRQEIEIEVEDFGAAMALLEALGYQVSSIYEKYRTEYKSNSLLVTLDELPFGKFIEIEGSDTLFIRQLANQLGLKWSANITANYLMLLDHFNQTLNIPLRDLTFENFAGLTITPQDLGVSPADED